MAVSWLPANNFGHYAHCDLYLANALILASYVGLRPSFEQTVRLDASSMGWLMARHIKDFASWERQVGGTFLAIFAWRWFRARSLDAGMAYLSVCAQLFVLVVSYVCGPWVLLSYALAFATTFLLFQQPMQPWGAAMEVLTPARLQELVLAAPGSGTTGSGTAAGPTAWVVVFYSDQHSTCRQLAGLLADLAARYRTEKLRFGHLNVAEFPATAKQFGIDHHTTSVQLPTVVLFEGGEEVARLPAKRPNGKLIKQDYRQADLVSVFDLEARRARSTPPDAGGAQAADGAAKTVGGDAKAGEAKGEAKGEAGKAGKAKSGKAAAAKSQ